MAPLSLVNYLEPLECTHYLTVTGQSEFVQDGSWPLEATGSARVGSLWIRGWKDQWMEGEGLKLVDDHRVWRVIQITPYKLRLIFDSRCKPKFTWIDTQDVSFSQRHWIEWPVYSIHNVARSIRHTAFAPGDLYWDDRGSEHLIRPLSGEEKWRVMELSL